MVRYDPNLGKEIERNRRIVKEYREHVLGGRWTHWVTLNFNWRRGRLSDAVAAKRFYAFMSELDIYLFGTTDYRYSRTEAIGIPENVETNRHTNVLMIVEVSKWKNMRAPAIDGIWRRLVPGGSAHVQMVDDQGAADYCTKQLWRPGYMDRVLYSEGSEEDHRPPKKWLPVPKRPLLRD